MEKSDSIHRRRQVSGVYRTSAPRPLPARQWRSGVRVQMLRWDWGFFAFFLGCAIAIVFMVLLLSR